MLMIPFLITVVFVLIANTFGLIDLDSRPFTRIIKWLLVAVCAWFLPVTIQQVLHIQLNPILLNLWKTGILAALFIWMISTASKWFWRRYGPAPEGYFRCKYCHHPVLKVMLECPECRKPLNS